MWACDPATTSMIANSYQVAGPVFVQALQSFFAAQCAMYGDHLWPDDALDAVLRDPNYDFVVVGAGSAGAVVANRLSEIPEWKVLLVEAGGNPTLTTEIPQVFYTNMGTTVDWGYRTQLQDGACRGYRNEGCSWPRGKVLGGSSSINAMFYVRGNKHDYDEWAADGNTGWSYDEVLPYFKKSENFLGKYTDEAKKYHQSGGFLNVANDENLHVFEDIIIKAAMELGLKNSTDVTGDSQMGVHKAFSTCKDGIRYSTARSFLSPVKERKNLHVIKNAIATKILFKPNTNVVSGVMINKDGKDIIVNVKKELIVSGGTINSAQLLLLSGIGPRKHLEDLGIEVKADLPVGENLQDHVFVPSIFTLPGDNQLHSTLPNIVQAFVQNVLNKQGPLSDTSPHRVISFTNTADPNSEIPDMQHHYIVFPPEIYNMLDIFEKHNLNDDIIKRYRDISKDNSVMIVYNVLLKPKSKGKILLKSTDPFEHPLIYANYFEQPDDLKVVIKSMKDHTLKLAETKVFKEIGLKLESIDSCIDNDKSSDEYLECVARELTFSLYHPTSTVKMGPDSDKASVVDPSLRVRHIKNLRVIDASIMPSVVRGNTNAPTIMIGEKGADMIKNYWLNEHTEL